MQHQITTYIHDQAVYNVVQSHPELRGTEVNESSHALIQEQVKAISGALVDEASRHVILDLNIDPSTPKGMLIVWFAAHYHIRDYRWAPPEE